MANQTWTKTTNGTVSDTLGNNVGAGDGAGTITLTSATVQVTNGDTLRIEEGVTIKMAVTAGTERFLVTRNATGSGLLKIVGTEAEPVIITSAAVTPAAGDYASFIELLNTVAASNPRVEADWCIVQHAITGIVNLSSTQPCTVAMNNCTFRRISQSHVQGGNPVSGAAGEWNFSECVFDKCPADGTNANNIIICTGSATMVQNYDHCSMSVQVDNGATEIEILQVSNGTLTVRNSVMSGFNASVTRRVDMAIIVGGTSTLVVDWNMYNAEGLGNYVPGANDTNIDPEFFDVSCSGNQDLRPNYDTGVMTADEFGARAGALDAYNIPVPPEPEPEPEPEVEECEVEYASFTDPSCVPLICDYSFFTGEYPDDWRRELYDRKEVSDHWLTVCIDIPNRGIDPSFSFAPGQPIPIIDADGESVTVNIGPWCQSMRPVRAERDVTFREYQGSDIDLVFMDWFGRLDPKIVNSLFYNIRWKGLRVEIGSWICGMQQVLKHGRWFLWDITRRNESTVLHLRDWFLFTLDRDLRANTAGYLVKKVKNDPASVRVENFIVDTDIAVVETVKLVFVDEGREDSRLFDYVGSETGIQGRGSIDAPFTTDDGGVTIPLSAWAGYPGIFVPGDELSFNVMNLVSGDPVTVCYQYLTQYGDLVEGTDIIQSEFFEAKQFLPTLAEIRLRHTKRVTLLEACRIAAQHGFLTLSTSGTGRVVMGGFKPTLALSLTQIQDVAICSSNDLIDMETANLAVYNLIRCEYDPREADGITHSGLVGGTPNRWEKFPSSELGDDFNRSFAFWGEYFPLDLKFPGFRAGQEAAVFAILQSYWAFFEGTPTAREKLTLVTKMHNLNRDLEQIVRVESERPARAVWAQIIGFAKEPVTSKEIGLTVVDISDIVQPNFACGYAFCDVNHYTDDCWVVW